MLVLSNDDLLTLLSPLEIVAAIDAAARTAAQGRQATLQRQRVEWSGNTLLIMPAVANDGVGIKLVSIVPSNSVRGLPVTGGLMVLADGGSGEPLAIMNAAVLTARRTGAVGALGVKCMTPPDTSSVGIIGCGVQGTWQAIFACAVRPIRQVFCMCRSAVTFEKFTSTLRRHVPLVSVTPCRDVLELLSRTELIITATTSAQPVLPDDASLLEGKHFISVGSFQPAMQELPDTVYRLAGQVAVDSEAARVEVGDLIGPVNRGILKPSDIFLIGQLLAGERAVNIAATTAYKSVGMALYDLFAAQAFYQAAVSRNIGQRVVL